MGTRLDEFEIRRLLGVGGFGMVYEAYDHSLQRLVAIKEYMPSALVGRSAGLLLTIRSAADNQTFAAGLKSFMAEARMLAQFDHPSLVKVFRFWEAHNTAYMVMPLYSGMTFAQARAQMRNPPSEAWLRKLLWSLLGALRVLHEANTVHRDVSPDNIFLQDLGPPVLLDLGAARRAITDQSHKLTAVLKVNYAPIEQYAGAGDMQQGPWSDLYALAAVVHGAVGGAAPVPATFRVLQDRMLPFAEVARLALAQTGQPYSPEFTEAIDRALVIRPEERTRSVDAFVQQMQLEPPEGGMARFDWRAGLVGGLVAAPELSGAALGWATAPDAPTIVLPAPAPAFAVPLDQRTQLLAARVEAVDPNATLILPPAARVLAPPADDAAVTTMVPAPEPAPRKPSKPPMTLPAREPATPKAVRPAKPPVPESSTKTGTGWLLGLLLVSIAAVAGGVWWMGQPVPTPPARPAAPAVAESVVPPQVPAGVPAVAANTLQPEPVVEPTAAASAATPLAVVSEPAVTAAAVRRASSAPVAARRERASEPKTRVEPAAAPAHVVPAPVPAEAPVRRPEPVAAPAATAGALCANSSVLARSACVHSECQKPANTSHPACVTLRSQQQASELYRN